MPRVVFLVVLLAVAAVIGGLLWDSGSGARDEPGMIGRPQTGAVDQTGAADDESGVVGAPGDGWQADAEPIDVLLTSSTVAVHVRDERGRGIAGALVVAGAGLAWGEPADEAGLVLVSPPAAVGWNEPRELAVGSWGYRSEALRVASDGDVEVGGSAEVVLARDTRLRVIVTCEHELLLGAALRVSVAAHGLDRDLSAFERSVARGLVRVDEDTGEGQVARFVVPVDGVVPVPHAVPGAPHVVRLWGVHGELLDTVVVTLPVGRWTDVPVESSARPARVEGVVRGVEHDPVAGVRVLMRVRDTEAGRSAETITDDDGRFVFDDVLGEAVILVAHGAGRGCSDVAVLFVTRPTTLAELVVRAVPSYRLVLADSESGHVAEGVSATATVAGMPFHASEHMTPGVLRFDNLPPGPAEIEARVSGRTFRHRREPGATSGVLEVPPFGTLLVRVRHPAELAGLLRLSVRPLGGQGQRFSIPAIPTTNRADFLAPVVFDGSYLLEVITQSDEVVATGAVDVIAGTVVEADLAVP